MTALLAFLRGNWKWLGLAILLGIQTYRLDTRSTELVASQRATERSEAAHVLFATRVRAKAEEIQRRAAVHALGVERRQNQVSQEVSRDFENRIADLQRTYADLLRRNGGGGSRPGGGAVNLPANGGAAGQPDGQAGADRLSLADRYLCSIQSTRLDELQRWLRAQLAIPRDLPHEENER